MLHRRARGNSCGRPAARGLLGTCRLLIAATLFGAFASAAATPGKVTTPRFKWGQSKETIYLSVMVRDLDAGSISVSLPTVGDLHFEAATSKGEVVTLDLPLREDVKPETMKWEVSARPDKWGTVVLITLSKATAHRWDILVTTPKKFKGLMDKDWTREDTTLEPEDEVPYVEDNQAHLTVLTDRNLNKTMAKLAAMVVNVRYPWCSHCKSQDDIFVKAAKAAKRTGKKDPLCKRVSFAVLDALEERQLARRLGAKCDYSCEYAVFTGVDEEPVTIKAQYSEDQLLGDLKKFLTPAVTVLSAAKEVVPMREKNTTCFGAFASEASPKYALFKKVAGLLRGKLVFAATFGEDKAVELWPQTQNFSFKYEGTWDDNGTEFLTWVKPRSIPLLQEYDWQLRETYENLGLPLAKLWINDQDKNPSFEKIIRYIVRRVAKKFIGRLAFVEQKKSTYSYELRDYGLNQPEVYPAFGIASNASYNSVKFGFEITSDTTSSAQDLWMDADRATEMLTSFCDKVLAGAWPEAHETAAPQTNWTRGMLKRLVWKTFHEVEKPEKPLLIQLYGRYRADNEKKMTEAENLATALAPHADAFTVASYDTSDNYLPPGTFKREKYSSDTEWYWVPAKTGADAERPPPKKLSKKDASTQAVVSFLKKASGLDIDTDAIMSSFEEAMKNNPPPAPQEPPSMGGDDFGAGGLGADFAAGDDALPGDELGKEEL
mmetsp:Transcript_16651/g.45486  ORF Transcript_16651/g.45486 Transcript_16651/m.45486 type:complete len:716 (-) Transcript_16651:107-2254(-)